MSPSIEAKLLVIIDKLKIMEQRISVIETTLESMLKESVPAVKKQILINELEEEEILFKPINPTPTQLKS